MKKLELKHLAHYLPYSLNLTNYEKKYSFELLMIDKFLDIDIIDSSTEWNGENHKGYNLYYNNKLAFYPILRPLSDLAKFKNNYQNSKVELVKKTTGGTTHSEYDEFLFLLENHFDVFGLIPNNLAVDINFVKKT